jgi:hypothetical protein
VNLGFSFVLGKGEAWEYGTVSTVKGWAQQYKTHYIEVIGLNFSAGFNFEYN